MYALTHEVAQHREKSFDTNFLRLSKNFAKCGETEPVVINFYVKLLLETSFTLHVVDVSKKEFLTLLSTFFKQLRTKVFFRSTTEKTETKLLYKNIVYSGKFSYSCYSAMLLKIPKFFTKYISFLLIFV